MFPKATYRAGSSPAGADCGAAGWGRWEAEGRVGEVCHRCHCHDLKSRKGVRIFKSYQLHYIFQFGAWENGGIKCSTLADITVRYWELKHFEYYLAAHTQKMFLLTVRDNTHQMYVCNLACIIHIIIHILMNKAWFVKTPWDGSIVALISHVFCTCVVQLIYIVNYLK